MRSVLKIEFHETTTLWCAETREAGSVGQRGSDPRSVRAHRRYFSADGDTAELGAPRRIEQHGPSLGWRHASFRRTRRRGWKIYCNWFELRRSRQGGESTNSHRTAHVHQGHQLSKRSE